MNQHLNFLNTPMSIIFSLLIAPLAFAENAQIIWVDNSVNEDGFIVERRLENSDAFQRISIQPANVSNYVDEGLIVGETYCYRISAFNRVGQSSSEESCVQVGDIRLPADGILLSHQFTVKPVVIEIGEKEFYSFKTGVTYNEWYSDDEIYNIELSVNKGVISYKDRNFFRFQKEGVELENGFARMKFNTQNNLSFVLQGHGLTQVATLYIRAKALGDDASSIIVTAGDKVEVITLPDGDGVHYFSVKIEFDDAVPVSITTDSNRKGGLMFAGIVFDKAN